MRYSKSTSILAGETITKTCCTCGQEFQLSDAEERRIKCNKCRNPIYQKVSNSNSLQPREKQVVRLIGQALSNKEIAARLHLTPGTVKEYVSRILEKTGKDNRVALAMLAWEWENVPPSPQP